MIALLSLLASAFAGPEVISPRDPRTTLVLAGSVSNNSTGTYVVATGMTFTPEPNATYLVDVSCAFSASSTAVGIRAAIGDSATAFDASGAFGGMTRGSGIYSPSQSFASMVASSGSPSGIAPAGTQTTGSGLTLWWGQSILTADATPAEVGLYFAPEEAGTITAVGGKCLLSYLPISP